MTIPWLMNCAHSEDSWCLECVGKMGAENAALREKLAAAEARIEVDAIALKSLQACEKDARRLEYLWDKIFVDQGGSDPKIVRIRKAIDAAIASSAKEKP